MPWNNGPGNDTGPNPWGGGPPPRRPGRPGGGSGGGPGGLGPVPDLDQLIGRIQAWFAGLLPGGKPGRRGFVLLAVLVVAIWLASGFYRVEPDEQGVVLRFGGFVGTTAPGLNYHLPWPIESVDLPAVTRINRIDVGYRSNAAPDSQNTQGLRDVPQESLMLTGDENIIDINFSVFWKIGNAPAYLFNTRNPDATVKSAAESVMREVIGRTPIQPALTEARAQIEQEVMEGSQRILDEYKTGVEITQVQLQRVDPPAEVIDSFVDVQRANTDAERMRNEAQAYQNDIVPRARGDAAAIVAAADADRQASIARATGESQRFLSVLSAYEAAKDITMRRLYIETMEDVLSHAGTTVVDDRAGNLVPFLPLGGPGQPAPGAAPPPFSTPSPPTPPPSSPPSPALGPSAQADTP
jgi:modulator of FtsH protease HflK